MKILRKIPITIWTLIILFVIAIIFYCLDFELKKDDGASVFANIVTVIGVLFVAIQINKQSKESIISTEFLNQPNFKFIGAFSDELLHASPGFCAQEGVPNYNQCNDLHWFDFFQTGNLPAKNVKVSLIHKDEKDDLSKLINSRTIEVDLLYPGDKQQFKLAPLEIPLELLDLTKNGEFYILLDYLSAYSKIRYKRIYELDYAPKVPPNAVVSGWATGIHYFSLKLNNFQDSLSISWKSVFKNSFLKLMRHLKLKKDFDISEWLIDL